MHIVGKLFLNFKCGCPNTYEAKQSIQFGRSNLAVAPEYIKNMHKIVLEDRKKRARDIADYLIKSESIVVTVSHEHLTQLFSLHSLNVVFSALYLFVNLKKPQ